jgi:hypothetical protein
LDPGVVQSSLAIIGGKKDGGRAVTCGLASIAEALLSILASFSLHLRHSNEVSSRPAEDLEISDYKKND